MGQLPNKIFVEDIFPDSLQSLTVGADYSVYFGSDIEFALDLSKFKYLDSFSSSNSCFKIMNFPGSLTVLKLIGVKGINFKELKNLMNLKCLCLEGYSELPDLEIDSPNLMNVNLDFCKLGELTREKLKLPSSVLEISMIYCEIESIDDSFQFPPQLQELYLMRNKLREVPSNLPSTLKKLDLSHNNFEHLTELPSFPQSLNELELSDNNLRQLTSIPSFPKSLKYLNIRDTGITKDKLGSEYDKLVSNLVQLNM